MSYFWATLGWIWGKKLFFALIFVSAALFMITLFPFSDLSDVVTGTVARATQGQVYVQFETLNLGLVPQPSISTTQLSVETSMPALKAKYAKVTPSLFSVIFNLPTLLRAAGGDAEAAASLPTKLGASVVAQDLMGADISLSVGPGSRGEQGNARSRVSLAMQRLNLTEVQKWADLPMNMRGQLHLNTETQFAPDFKEQPESEILLRVEKFVLPAWVIQVDMNGTPLPVNLPEITLANVKLKGKMSRGNFTIEDGQFGQKIDAISGRIKGTLGVQFVPMGGAVTPVFGSYNLTVEMTTSQMIEKELNFAFIMLGPGRTATPGGGAHYLLRAMGQGIGMEFVPNITRLPTF